MSSFGLDDRLNFQKSWNLSAASYVNQVWCPPSLAREFFGSLLRGIATGASSLPFVFK
jgi:hypothetical protein